MSNFSYTNVKETPESSVVGAVYYNADDAELVVELHNGTLAGYADVPVAVFLAMATHYDARDEGGSLGRYWNLDVKNNYDGFDTSWIDGFEDVNEAKTNDDGLTEDEADALAAFGGEDSFVTDTSTAFPATVGGVTWDVPVATILPVDPPVLPLNEYVVGFDFARGENEYDAELTVFASSPDSALTSFGSAVDLLGYESVKVKFVTRFFN